jgi:hypothetical protein
LRDCILPAVVGAEVVQEHTRTQGSTQARVRMRKYA